MRFSSLADPGCYIVGLYQEQCCHANGLISAVQRKTEVIRTIAVSRVLPECCRSQITQQEFQLFPPIDFLIPTINKCTHQEKS